ncbi:MFS transporter [Streptomyces sp. PanSC19]|uniref:MFS transporter n=1 Tax=Streptomyces sp. PanSC19 TaxID=1520455 RepID=UPI000F48EDF7|nr:MFS transporter [Streptomyces sp. PanSC19]ROQ26681.1 MFS transporter [Streptomyces sp. PanSC19]
MPTFLPASRRVRFSRRARLPHGAPSPWCAEDFRVLFSASVLSTLGTNVSYLAVPMVAVLALDAGPGRVGLLASLSTAAFLLIGLPAGAWVDRMRHRTVLIVADLLRAALLAWIPMAWWLGVLTFGGLCAVVFLSGVATVLFDVASQSVLPRLVEPAVLIPANSALVSLTAAGNVAGRGAGGALVQLLGAPLAVVCAAAGHLGSGLRLLRMARDDAHGAAPEPVATPPEAAETPDGTGLAAPETAAGTAPEGPTSHAGTAPERPAPPAGTAPEAPASPTGVAPGRLSGRAPGLRAQIAEGLRHVLGHAELRALALTGAVGNLGTVMVNTMLPVVFPRELGLSAGALGLFWAAGGIGLFLGARCARPLADRFGHGRGLVVVDLCLSPAGLLVPLMDRGAWLWAAGAGWVAFAMRTGAANVLGVSLRQRLTPGDLLGRMNATFRFLLTGSMAVAGALAGAIGAHCSPRTALWAGGALLGLSFLPVVFSPLRRRRELPTGEAPCGSAAPAPRENDAPKK